MQTFRIKASSWVIYFITFFSILIGGGFLFYELFPKNNTTETLILFILLMGISIIVVRKAGIAITHWKLSDKNIEIIWVTQFIFHKRQNLNIKWDDIYGYKIRHERMFDLLKIVLTNGTVVRLWHDNIITKDDFDKFITSFLKKVESHNKEEMKKLKFEKGKPIQ